MTSRTSRLKGTAAPFVLALATVAAPAYAQAAPPADNAPPEEQTIVVTGSRIARPDLQSASPVAVVSAENLKIANAVTAESLLTQNPQFVAGLTGATNNGSGGVATVDLRGLGDQRTLVLINGKRMVPADILSAVDINAIPTVLIKHIDVLTGGASAVYGADAIAGVVNFVLDDKLTGFKVDASHQITGRGDAFQQDYSAAAGTALGNFGHFVIAGQYSKRAGVYQGARAYSAQNLDSGTLKPSGSSNATPTVIDIKSGRYQLNNGSQPGATGDFVAGNYLPYNFNPANYFLVPMERYNVTAMASFDLSPTTQLYLQGSYTRSKVTATLAPTATAGFNFKISPNNPYLNADNFALIFGDPTNLNPDGTANVGIRRRVTETGGRIEKFRSDVYYGVGGIKGELGSSLHYDVFAQYGVSKRHEDLLNDLDYNKLSQAINAVPGAGGTVVCADPSGGCAPINLFTLNPVSPAALNFVLANGAQDNRYTQFVTGASLAGDLGFLKSPWSDKPAAFAFGVEYRSETGSQIVDANYGSGNLIYYGQGTSVPHASFNVKEVYGELKLPLAEGRPLLESLSLEAGARYSAYTNHTVDGTNKNNQFTFKLGAEWAPVRGLRFRTMFNRAVRDPNINELNSPITQAGTDNLNTDPCALGRPQGNATLAAICIAQGAPASLVNSGVIQDVISGQTNINVGGNTALKPEKANTFTAGVVVNPSWLRNFNLTVDYYKVKITDYIAKDSAQDISNQCFTNNNASYCSLFVRSNITGQLTGSPNSNGQFPGVNELYVNIASLQTQGVDVSADYHFDLGTDSRVRLGFSGTYVGQWLYSPGGAAAPFTCAGKFGNVCSLNTGNPIPRWKHTADLTYEGRDWSITTRWRLIGAVSEDDEPAFKVQHIPSYSYFDSTLSFDVAKKFTFRVGVQNIFDIDPPIVGGTAGSSGTNAGNTFPQVYDFLGRTFFAGISAQF